MDTFLGACCPLPALKSCFVEFSQSSNVLSMNCGGESGLPVLFLHHLRTAPLRFFFFFLSLVQGEIDRSGNIVLDF